MIIPNRPIIKPILVKRMKNEGHWVRGVDLKYPEFGETSADDFVISEVRNLNKNNELDRLNLNKIFSTKHGQ